MSSATVVSPAVKPICVSLTSGDGEVRIPSLNRRPGGGFAPWSMEGLVADLVPKRGSVVWGRDDVSLADVSSVLHSSRPFVARISSFVLGGSEREVYALSSVEFVTKFCNRCVGL